MDFVDRVSPEKSLKEPLLLFDTLLRVSQILRLKFNEWLAGFELNEGRYAVLKTLANSPETGCSQAELADQLGQSESNVSTLIERMQRDGMVSRLRSEADRRKRILRITSEGRIILSQVETKQSAWASQMLKGISLANQSTLVVLLHPLGAAVQRSSGIALKAFDPTGDSPGFATGPANDDRLDPVDDPKTPQFALQQMLLALSVRAGNDSLEKDAA